MLVKNFGSDKNFGSEKISILKKLGAIEISAQKKFQVKKFGSKKISGQKVWIQKNF